MAQRKAGNRFVPASLTAISKQRNAPELSGAFLLFGIGERCKRADGLLVDFKAVSGFDFDELELSGVFRIHVGEQAVRVRQRPVLSFVYVVAVDLGVVGFGIAVKNGKLAGCVYDVCVHHENLSGHFNTYLSICYLI